jgi:hypothetical protein
MLRLVLTSHQMLALLEHTNCGSTPASALEISNEANSVSIDVQLANRIPGSSSREQRRDQPRASLLQYTKNRRITPSNKFDADYQCRSVAES